MSLATFALLAASIAVCSGQVCIDVAVPSAGNPLINQLIGIIGGLQPTTLPFLPAPFYAAEPITTLTIEGGEPLNYGWCGTNPADFRFVGQLKKVTYDALGVRTTGADLIHAACEPKYFAGDYVIWKAPIMASGTLGFLGAETLLYKDQSLGSCFYWAGRNVWTQGSYQNGGKVDFTVSWIGVRPNCPYSNKGWQTDEYNEFAASGYSFTWGQV